MRLREMKWGRKAVAAVSAVVLAATMTVAPLGGVQSAYAADAADTTGYVTCAAYRAATPAPEILGLSGVGTNDAFSTCGQLSWSSPFYYIFGTTEYNSNANPYMLNSVSNFNDGTSYANAMTYYKRQGGPNASMYAYGANTDSDAVWNLLPDVILGTGNSASNQVDYNTADYAVAAGAANGDDDYTTIGVNYQMTSIYAMITSMYDLAAAGDQVVADSNGTKQLRYGNATDIAKQYEQYVKGTQGYVLQQLAANGAEKKTVALVNNYDATSGTYTIVATGVSEGTAASNRYLEAVQNVATNLGDTTTTVTQEQLAAVDLIMLGSQSGSEDITSTEDILATFTTEMQNKTFWVNSENGSAGSCYGVVMNSVENAQNIGRILGCLYPEYIDQDQWITYYYDNFYHLNEGMLADAVDKAMDGVRNWDAIGADLTNWTSADAAGYNEAAVEAKLAAGVTYIKDNASSVSSLLAMADEYGEGPTAASSTTTLPDVSVTAPTFAAVQYGYEQPAAVALTITNAGTTDATISSVTADDSSLFTIAGEGSTVAAGESITTWTVQPAANLAIGTYSTTVSVTLSDNTVLKTSVSFTVNKATQDAPSGLAATAPSTKGASDGAITGLDSSKGYEYSTDDSTWTAVSTGSTTISGLAAGTYQVRLAATDIAEASAATSVTVPEGAEPATPAATTQVMYRLYNPNSGEHFYTASADEKNNLVSVGWNDEGTGWIAPKTSNTPVYRLYNPNEDPNTGSGEHHFTTSTEERDNLVSLGWQDEGIGWYSDDKQGVPLYRQYNPNQFNCNHNYTTSTYERDYLVSLGWDDEGIGWYGVAE